MTQTTTTRNPIGCKFFHYIPVARGRNKGEPPVVETEEFKYEVVGYHAQPQHVPSTGQDTITLQFIGKAFEGLLPQSFIHIPLKVFFDAMSKGRFAPVSKGDIFWVKQEANTREGNARPIDYDDRMLSDGGEQFKPFFDER